MGFGFAAFSPHQFGTCDLNLCLGLAVPRFHFGRGNDDVTACAVYEERLGVGICVVPLFSC